MKKKILVIHNFYRDFGGEDSNIYEELEFLKKYYDVRFYYEENKSTIKLSDIIGLSISNNKKTNNKLKKEIELFKPDVAYVHNTWFKVNLGIFKLLLKNNIRVILKIHNFRHQCTMSYLSKYHLQGQSRCSACNFDSKRNSFFNKYYEDSLIKSIFIIGYSKKLLKILKKLPIYIIAINSFHYRALLNLGINKNRLSIIYNPIKIESPKNIKKNDYVVYAGRISKEKGIENLLVAWNEAKLNKFELHLIGEGPQKEDLEKSYSSEKIKFLGQMDNDKVVKYISNAKAVATATKLYEGQPRLLCEASSVGTISIYPSFGGMNEFFPENYIFAFEQFNYADLVRKLKLLENNEFVDTAEALVKEHINKIFDENLIHRKFSTLLKEN